MTKQDKTAPESHSNEPTLGEEFQGTANEPLAWFYTAEALASTAHTVKKSDDEKGGGALLEDFGQMTRTRGIYAMLLGYAVECAIKGLYVKAGNEMAGPNGVLHHIPGFKSHNLRMMATTGKLNLSDNELKALDWLSGYIKHLGRYPIPAKAKHLEAPEGYGFEISVYENGTTKIHSTDSDHLAVAEALIVKLVEQLQPKKTSS